MMSPDSGKGSAESYCTPSQLQNSPLVRTSSSKRRLFHEFKKLIDSDSDSDMLGLSPLPDSDEYVSSPETPDQTRFSSLKKITQSARKFTPRKIIFPLSLSVPSTPPRPLELDEFVPETPQSCQETDSPVIQVINPLAFSKNSEKITNLRRKILLDENDESPLTEGSLKRHLEIDKDTEGSATKIAKTSDGPVAPKARTSLFQNFKPIEAKSFYGSHENASKPVVKVALKPNIVMKQAKNRKKLPERRKQFGQINNGVRHAIKKPKPKKPLKLEKLPKKLENEIKENFITIKNPDYKPKFIKKMEEPKPKATITLNNRIKLNVINKKIVLAEECVVPRKRAKLDISMDAADLSVDELATEEKSKVEDLLQMLENDWTEEDEEEEIQSRSVAKKAVSEYDFLMSPESELSNMTSVMNIEDNVNGTKETENDEENKLFPLFRKGFSANHVFEENDKKRGTKKPWHSSLKNQTPDQYQLDLGQKHFGAAECKECGVVYSAGDPTDENLHLNYHNSYRSLSFSGWKNERVVWEDLTDRIILVIPGDPKIHWNKVNQILKIVDLDLGLAEINLCEYQDKKIYMYIRGKMILGVLVAEHKEFAYKMIPDLLDFDCCTKESSPVKCGINVVWAAMKYRQQKIATKLADTLRRNFYYGYIMTLDDIAFSMPTPSGKIFAQKYTKSLDFKVYN